MSFLFRNPRALLVLGSSALGGAAYRYSKPASPSDASLNPHTFTPYTLIDKKPVSSTSAIFTLRNRDGSSDPESVSECWKRSVWSVQVKQPQLQIARAYTPLPPCSEGPGREDGEPEDIRLLVRQERGGEVSTYLHRLPEQSTIELRGPNVECELPDDIRDVIFLAGGTGIAPAMQIAQAMAPRTGSTMHILWANRRREECVGGVNDDEVEDRGYSRSGWLSSLFGGGQRAMQEGLDAAHSNQGTGVIVQELEGLKERIQRHTGGLTVQYYVDDEKKFIKPGDVTKLLELDAPGETGSKIIFVSGPDGFITHWAGKKEWIGGREEQGRLGGMLGQMDLKGWTVFKL